MTGFESQLMPKMQTDKRPAFVLAGSGGLGREICRELAGRGRPVFFTYRSDAAAANDFAHEIDGRCARADSRDANSIAAALTEAVNWAGPPQAAVFAAGVPIAQPYVSKIEAGEWERVIDVELLGLTRFVAALLPSLRETSASFVCLTSVATASYIVGDALSAVPKAGMEMLMRAVAREEGRFGVRANCVAPGLMKAGLGADFMENLYSPEVWEAQKNRTPLRRFGEAGDVAAMVALLASDEASFVTGQTIYADGGLRL